MGSKYVTLMHYQYSNGWSETFPVAGGNSCLQKVVKWRMYLKYRHPIVQSEEITLHYNLLWRRLPVIVVSGFVIKQFIPSRTEHVVTLAWVLCEVTANNERDSHRGSSYWV